MNPRCCILIPVLVLGALASPDARAGSPDVYVTKSGYVAPTGSQARPHLLVESGICAVSDGGTLHVGPGRYLENLHIDRPVTIAADGGPVHIGEPAGLEKERLKILTYNTHLFGDEVLGILPQFEDETRAAWIAERILDDAPDVAGLIEVWDEEMEEIIRERVQDWYWTFFTDETDEADDFLTSGLMLLVRKTLAVESASEHFYEEEIDGSACLAGLASCLPCAFAGPACVLETGGGGVCAAVFNECYGVQEAFGSKGFLEATIRTPGGFRLGVFATHAAFGWDHDKGILDQDEFEIRRKQLEELANAAAAYRSAHPDHFVIAMGDFNVIEASPYSEYQPMLPPFDAAGTRDAALAAPCYVAGEQYTEQWPDNDLFVHFESDDDLHFSQRLDYMFYTPVTPSGLVEGVPEAVRVRRYMSDVLITGDEIPDGTKDLSDHYALMLDVDLYRDQGTTVGAAPGGGLGTADRGEEVEPDRGRGKLGFSIEGSRVRLSLPEAGYVRTVVYDVAGRRVRTIQEGILSGGEHEIRWDGRDAGGRETAPGIYFVRLETGDAVERGKIAKLR